jgi:hypothetical protein
MLTNKLMQRWVKRTELGGDRVFIWSGGRDGRKKDMATTTAAVIKQSKREDIYVGGNERSELYH